MLLAEIVPGIAHRANDLLMEISGTVTLAERKREHGTDGRSNLSDLLDSCEELIHLLNKMTALSRILEKKSGQSDVAQCIQITADITNSRLEKQVAVLQSKTGPLWVRGEFSRLCHCFKLILKSLIARGDGNVRIRVAPPAPRQGQETESRSRGEIEWVRITFETNLLEKPMASEGHRFYHSLVPLNVYDCQMAAAENIVRSYNGRMEYESGIRDQYHIDLPKA